MLISLLLPQFSSDWLDLSYAGFQLLDAFLCSTNFFREYSKIWIATIFLGKSAIYIVIFHDRPTKHLFFTKHWLLELFQACVLAPSVKGEKKVRSILEGLCDSANRQVVICFKIFCIAHSRRT